MKSNRVVIGALTAALLVGACGSSGSAQQTSDSTTTTVADVESAGLDGAETGSAAIDGDPLPPAEGNGIIASSDLDPAIGTTVPTMSGTNFNGGEVTIGADGRPKAIYFVAHWCPHCQVEVELIESLASDGRLPSDIDLYAVSIAVRPDSDNFPPSTWLANFPGTVMRDDTDNSAATAAGVSGIPYVLYVDGDNNLLARSVGGLNESQVIEQWNSLLPEAS
ncbi:MAG: TlpA family protein disulfide reductase [Acidimicrobiia bacterium]